MIDWMKQYPSVWVTRIYDGDRLKAVSYIGEGNKLLYQVKNNMGFNNLGCLKMERIIKDIQTGVVLAIIKAKSIFGHDTIYTYCPPVALEGTCSITLFNVPDIIPPMKWYAPGLETWEKVGDAWVIKDPDGIIEVEGIDYLKTYYGLNITDCNECSSLISTVCETKELALARCHPYIYDATKLLYQNSPVPYFQGWPDRVPPALPDPENHLIYSLEGSGQAEILKFESDNQGTYFLWKAYTEWGSYPPTSITFSRTGLGYLLLKAFIQFEGIELCKAEGIVKVDCCEKDISLRNIKQPDRPEYSGLWWESDTAIPPLNCWGQPFMFHGSMKMCEVPSEISTKLLFVMACIPVSPVAFYVLPDVFGSCLPYEWTLTGPGIWTPGGNYGEIGYYGCAEIECHQEITIHVQDRCGSIATVHAKSCCESAETLSIGYTSLLMSCGGQQTFTNIGGCGPYTWAVSGGGGSIEFSPPGYTAIYTAPATNPNCVDNPTITVTDCCGSTAEIKLAVNCYTDAGTALKMCDQHDTTNCQCVEWYGGICTYWAYWARFSYYTWDCYGNYIVNDPGTFAPWSCRPEQCPSDCMEINCQPCGTPCGALVDIRTALMKEQGCCPINPLTGLPY